MSLIVGIDLGTTNSLVAVVEAGIPYVMADADGRRLTPSVVHFAADGSTLVGEPARRVRALYPKSTFYSVKRFMGRRAREISASEREVDYPLEGDGAETIRLLGPQRAFSPEEISAEVLRKLKADAEASMGQPVERAVITVPAYFNDGQRQATLRAGEMAGWKVERIINEPTAAALAYGLDRLREKSKIAVYDLGGGTFDLSILELNEGIFQVLSTNGNTRLGGDDFDAAIVGHLAGEILARHGLDVLADPALRARLREAAEAAKIRLSNEMEAEILLPFLTPSVSYQRVLTRAELENLTLAVVQRTRAHCLRALADAKLEPSALDQVVLVGGQTRMPLVRQMVGEWFCCVEFEATSGSIRLGTEFHRPEGPMLNTSQNPDEAVALGAAIQGAILSGGISNMLLLDITPLSLGLETFGGLMNVIIPRNSTIPLKAGEVFTTAVDHQKAMMIHVLQGERERAKDNWSLGKFTIDFASAAKGVARVGVQYEIDANGVLHVLARDLQTMKETVVQLKSAVDVADADVQRMVEESVEHAWEDLSARRWIEASLRAKETISATRQGLADCGAELGEDQRAGIESALQQIESMLAQAEQSTGGVGDPKLLKEAHTVLDQATQPLADLMMDKAAEAMLSKRGLI